MMRSGFQLRQCDSMLRNLTPTPTGDLRLGRPWKKGFWLVIFWGPDEWCWQAARRGGVVWIKAVANWSRRAGRPNRLQEGMGLYQNWFWHGVLHSSPQDGSFVDKEWPGPRDTCDNELWSYILPRCVTIFTQSAPHTFLDVVGAQ